MERDIVDPEFPFTEAEHTAAWILLGMQLAEVQEASQHIRTGMAEATGVSMTPGFAAAINLAADVHASGLVLTHTAREAWLLEWPLRVSEAEAERRLEQLALLGESWSAKRDLFRRLLTTGRL